eukprot:gene20073-19979_t
MSISRVLRIALLSATISVGAVTSVGAADKARSGCDASVEFKARDGKIDARSYKRVKTWLGESREISSFEESSPRPDGSLKLCVMAASKEGIRPVYTALTLLVDRSYGGVALVRVQNRYGGLFDKKRVKFYGRTPGVPRNNGLPQRPPSDKWN